MIHMRSKQHEVLQFYMITLDVLLMQRWVKINLGGPPLLNKCKFRHSAISFLEHPVPKIWVTFAKFLTLKCVKDITDETESLHACSELLFCKYT